MLIQVPVPPPEFERHRSGLIVPREHPPVLPYTIGMLGAAKAAARGRSPAGGGGAIALVGGLSGNTVTGTSDSYTFDVGSGSDRYLILFVQSAAAATLSATFNGVSLSSISSGTWFFAGGRWNVLRLIAPDAGSHTLAISATVSGSIRSAVAAYTGVHQTTPEDVAVVTAGGGSGSSTGRTLNVTTSTEDAWLVLGAGTQTSRDIAASTGATLRSSASQDLGVMDSDGGLSAGANSIAYSVTGGSGQDWAAAVALRPA